MSKLGEQITIGKYTVEKIEKTRNDGFLAEDKGAMTLAYRVSTNGGSFEFTVAKGTSYYDTLDLVKTKNGKVENEEEEKVLTLLFTVATSSILVLGDAELIDARLKATEDYMERIAKKGGEDGEQGN